MLDAIGDSSWCVFHQHIPGTGLLLGYKGLFVHPDGLTEAKTC
jgi:hypothetical protein